MNREIKFKLWIIDEHRMCNVRSIYENCGCTEDEENEIYLQYTGLKDKNGVEIYEGDILSLSTHPSSKPIIVKYHEGSACYIVGVIYLKDFLKLGSVEVVGNIYENPELLGDK